jgi:hypothetical protein
MYWAHKAVNRVAKVGALELILQSTTAKPSTCMLVVKAQMELAAPGVLVISQGEQVGSMAVGTVAQTKPVVLEDIINAWDQVAEVLVIYDAMAQHSATES